MSCRFFRIFSLVCCCLISILDARSQIIESNSEREKMFVFEVKHIDEFIERFNYEQRALIISYVKMNYPGIVVDRGSLITNLFNRQNKQWVRNDVDSFFSLVNNEQNPVYLDFYSNNWYAEAQCRFMYKGKPVDVSLFLKIRQDTNGGSKWVIMSAYAKAIAPASSSLIDLPVSQGNRFINPMSHATNFMSLSVALRDKLHFSDYLDSSFAEYPASRSFLQALIKDQLEYQYVRQITYHFLQVDGWAFTVNRFRRKSVNSGWLISRLWKASGEEKAAYTDSLFRRPR